jgi:hypothetical protein
MVRVSCAGNAPVLLVAWDKRKDPSVVSESEGRSLAERLGVPFVEMYPDPRVVEMGLVTFLETMNL